MRPGQDQFDDGGGLHGDFNGRVCDWRRSRGACRGDCGPRERFPSHCRRRSKASHRQSLRRRSAAGRLGSASPPRSGHRRIRWIRLSGSSISRRGYLCRGKHSRRTWHWHSPKGFAPKDGGASSRLWRFISMGHAGDGLIFGWSYGERQANISAVDHRRRRQPVAATTVERSR